MVQMVRWARKHKNGLHQVTACVATSKMTAYDTFKLEALFSFPSEGTSVAIRN